MPKCLRCGCPNPRTHPDTQGLGLCADHYRQLSDGTIGQTHNTRTHSHPHHDAIKLLNTIAPTGSLRTAAKKTGLSKDTIRNIRQGNVTWVNSSVWERLQEAHARHNQPRKENNA